MARFNTVQLDSIYFTKTGLSNGTPCKLSVRGLDALKTTKSATIKRALDGTPYRLNVDFDGKGFDISVTVEILPEAIFDDINDAIEAAINAGDTMELTITGDTGTFNLTVIPGEDPVQFDGEFINERIKNVTYNFVTS